MTAYPFWREAQPLVLASGSAARRSLLEAAAIPLVVAPADIDEREVEEPLRIAGAAPAEIARHLAEAKASAVSRDRSGALVLGGDQVLASMMGRFNKPKTTAEVRYTLEVLSGRSHTLHAGWALARNGQVLRSGVARARLDMRELSSGFLDAYIATEGETLFASVGAYRFEGPGILLFNRIIGDQPTILGLPMLPVLAALRDLGALLA